MWLSDRFGLRVREYAGTRRSPAELRADPRGRADDLNAAFADDDVRAVFMSIGGDDSARILPYVDLDLIAADPKIIMGYSDSVTQLLACHSTGLITFHGPAVMAGFAQIGDFPAAEAHRRSMLFEPRDTLTYEPFPEWVDGYLDWNEGNAVAVGERRTHDRWHWLQGEGSVNGRWWGGCAEVLEFMKGTRWWPSESFWDDRVLFLEASEDVSSVEQLRYWLFNDGLQGIFDRISGLVIGRARSDTDEMKAALDEAVIEVLAEFEATELTVVTNVDIGHTDPQWIVPIGGRVELDITARSIRLTERVVD